MLDISNKQLLQSMRYAAFERAKAELASIMHFSYSTTEDTLKRRTRYHEFYLEFIDRVEREGLLDGVE